MAPSLFDVGRREKYSLVKFLDHFIDAVTRPVVPDGREHIEYAPTQVMTEYLRWVPTRQIDGIAFPSSRSTDGAASFVFFFGPESVEDASVYAEATTTWERPISLGFDVAEDPSSVVCTLAAEDVNIFEI